MNVLLKVTLFTLTGLCIMTDSLAVGSGVTSEVVAEVRHDTSRPLRELLLNIRTPDTPVEIHEVGNIFLTMDDQWKTDVELSLEPSSANVQRSIRAVTANPVVDSSFEGMSNTTGVLPPDTNGDVGLTQYIQYINTGWSVFDKATGAELSGPNAGNSFWAGFGGICESSNSGDPIVLYDELADRWMFSQFTTSAEPAQCFAVSTTSDPLGPYHRYEFPFTPFNDYPHIGVWSDQGGAQSSYVFVTHDFDFSVDPPQFVGASFVAVDRNSMIAGNAAEMVRFSGINAYGAQPPHLEGLTLPTSGTCAPFVHMRSQRDGYRFWDFCVDWNTPANTTLSAELVLLSDSYSQAVGSIPQPGTSEELDSFASNTMYRASVRSFGEGGYFENAMTINHVTNVGNNIAGIRWLIINIPNQREAISKGGFEDDELLLSTLSIIDQGNYSPDSEHRWMGSISMDKDGGLGLGYSVGSEVRSPEIRLTGRKFSDPTGQLSAEVDCTIGATGSQTSTFDRWGDYSSMSIDPVDHCTFWFTTEYLATTSTANWTTRICSFHMPDCGQGSFKVMALEDQKVTMCAATDPDPRWRLDVMSTGAYNADITLSVLGLPAPAVASFTKSVISEFPSASTITLTNVSSLAHGDYNFDVQSIGGIGTQLEQLTLGVSQNLPSVPVALSPANNSIDNSVKPHLTWDALGSASTYIVEISTDSGFNTIIESAEVTQTDYYVHQVLAASTDYYWRLTAKNYCGVGVSSPVFSFTTGIPGTCPGGTTENLAFADDMESGENGWTHSGIGDTWQQQAASANDGLTGMVWFAEDINVISDQYLVSPAISIPAGQQPATLSYFTYYNIEDAESGCWDGGLLEISTDGGSSWLQLQNDVMLSNPYTGNINQSPESAISGKPAWCGENGPVESIVDVSAYAGATVQLRYRLATDGSVGADGWYIDDVKVETCQ